jgi:hypothetical protein
MLPPWLLLAATLGVIHGAACFMLIGRRLTFLPMYAVLGALAASVGQVFGRAVGAPEPLLIGELNLLTASCAPWVLLTAARVAGL